MLHLPAAALTRPFVGGPLRGGLAAASRRQCHAWQPPTVDCYAMLGVSKSASSSDIREAYMTRAKKSHPDIATGRRNHDGMVQLNLCYEALTKRRTEYDSAKGTGPAYQRSYASSGSTPWWKTDTSSRSGGMDDFEEFFMDAEDAFYGGKTRWQHHEATQAKPSWQQWAREWQDADDWVDGDGQRGRRHRRNRGARNRAPEGESSDEAEDLGGRRQHEQRGASYVGDSDDEDSHPSRQRRRKADSGEDSRRPPTTLWLSAGGGRGLRGRALAAYEALAGKYHHAGSYSGRPVYEQKGRARHYLFWSREFQDWRLADRCIDDGRCTAFAMDQGGNRGPWLNKGLKWKVFDKAARSFVRQPITFDLRRPKPQAAEEETDGEEEDGEADTPNANSSGSSSSSASGAGDRRRPKAEAAQDTAHHGQEAGKGEDSGEAPWSSRLRWEKWSTSDLIRWCNRKDVDLSGCLDRDAVLEQVLAFAARDEGSSSDHGHQKASKESAIRVQLASRMKTDGSYTRPPMLDQRSSTYGNRVERFRGPEPDIYRWLEVRGDKSRLYGIFLDGEFSYSMVWRRQKNQWGRLSRPSTT